MLNQVCASFEKRLIYAAYKVYIVFCEHVMLLIENVSIEVNMNARHGPNAMVGQCCASVVDGGPTLTQYWVNVCVCWVADHALYNNK